MPDVRIDSAHLLPASPERTAPVRVDHAYAPGAGAAPNLRVAETADASQQLRTQAVQLADHLTQRQDDLERREAELDARAAETEASLGRARLWFSQREAELLKLRQRWIEEHRQAKADIDAARRQQDEQRRRDWAELQERRRSLERRAEAVDSRWAALQQVHEEVLRTHRETVQLRLACEELRAELAPLAPAEEQQRMLERIRARLSEEYRLASRDLLRQKEELLALRRELAEQHRIVSQESDRLHRLAANAALGRRRLRAATCRLDPAATKTDGTNDGIPH